jgi:hypothetical protein
MIVKNPTKSDITVKIDGTEYSVAAESEIKGVYPAHALQWQKTLHAFLELKDEKSDTVLEVQEVEEVEEVVEEILEVEAPVTASEAPKVPVAKKK